MRKQTTNNFFYYNLFYFLKGLSDFIGKNMTILYTKPTKKYLTNIIYLLIGCSF